MIDAAYEDCYYQEVWSEAAVELYNLKLKIKELEVKEAELTKTLIELSGDETREDEEFEFKRVPTKGSIDYKVIPELKAIDLEQYRKESRISWRLVRKDKAIEIINN